MTKQINPIDIHVNTWGEAIEKMNEAIDFVSTEGASLNKPNTGNIEVSGSSKSTSHTSNEISANNVTANTATLITATIETANITNLEIDSITVPTINATTGDITDLTVGELDVTGNVDANSGYIKTFKTDALTANSIVKVTSLLGEITNLTATDLNANTFTTVSGTFTNIIAKGRDNLDKLASKDFIASRILSLDANEDLSFTPYTALGLGILNAADAASVKTQIGLDKVSNLTPAEYPVSTATQTALNSKANNSLQIQTTEGIIGGGQIGTGLNLQLSQQVLDTLARVDESLQPGDDGTIPEGGLTGQVLTKNSGLDFDVSWKDASDTSAYVTGPISSIDGEIAVYDGATGKKIKGAQLSITALNSSLNDVGLNTAARHNHTNKAILDATTASYTSAEKSKLAVVDNRANHTGTQSIETITGLTQALNDKATKEQGDKADTAVSYVPQTLTTAQQEQARDNINAASKASLDEKLNKAGDTGIGGYSSLAVNDGVKSSGTYTPSPTGSNFRSITNGGNFTLAAPTASGSYNLTIDITNNASAGMITFMGFAPDNPKGDDLTVTSGHKFKLHISKTGVGVTAQIEALQ